MDILQLPFNKFVGIERREFDGVERVCLEPRNEHRNHVGTIHASVLFALAEAASGHVLLEAFADMTNLPVALLRSSTVKYRKPANQTVHASATIDQSIVSNVKEKLSKKQRALVDIETQVRDADRTVVFTGTFSWFLLPSSVV